MKCRVLILLASGLLLGCSIDDPPSSKTETTDFQSVVDAGTRAIERGDYQQAYELALPFAEAGDPEAQFAVAVILGSGKVNYRSGQRADDLDAEILAWYRLAALQGHSEPAETLADAYSNGWLGLDSNSDLALCWRSVSEGARHAKSCNDMETRGYN